MRSFGVAVSKNNAERLKEFLIEKGLFAANLKPKHTKSEVIFAIKEKPKKVIEKQIVKKFKAKIVEDDFSEIRKSRSLKDALQNLLTEEEAEALVSSFDSIGKIAIIEIPKELRKKAKLIAKTLLELNKNIETVCMIAGPHKGKYRVRKLKVIAGKRNFITLHRESGCIFKVDVSKVFFSPRLSYERLRIAKQIKGNEVLGVFFAGVGPFAIVAAKHSKLNKAVAIEINPAAYKLMKENIALNKLQQRVIAIKGDVKEVVKEYKDYFDRIVMPLPKHSANYLGEAFYAAKKGAIIHYYREVKISEGFNQAISEIKEAAAKYNRKVKILFKRKVRSFSATEIQVVIDFSVC